MKIERKVNKDGGIELFVNDLLVQSGKYPVAENVNKIYGCKICIRPSIICDSNSTKSYAELNFGDFKTTIDISNSCADFTKKFMQCSIADSSMDDIAKVIENNINVAHRFVAECLSKSETIEIKDIAEISADLQKEGKLYYRNSKGQITKLD